MVWSGSSPNLVMNDSLLLVQEFFLFKFLVHGFVWTKIRLQLTKEPDNSNSLVSVCANWGYALFCWLWQSWICNLWIRVQYEVFANHWDMTKQFDNEPCCGFWRNGAVIGGVNRICSRQNKWYEIILYGECSSHNFGLSFIPTSEQVFHFVLARFFRYRNKK